MENSGKILARCTSATSALKAPTFSEDAPHTSASGKNESSSGGKSCCGSLADACTYLKK